MKRLILAFLVYLAWQSCGYCWQWPSGWDLSQIKPTSIIYPGMVQTTNFTLTTAQSGNVIVFNNSTGVAASGTMFTLPAATVGVDYTVVADTAKWFYLAPQSGDIINLTSTSTGQRVDNRSTAAVGDSISVQCVTAGQWSVYGRQGTWAASAGG